LGGVKNEAALIDEKKKKRGRKEGRWLGLHKFGTCKERERACGHGMRRSEAHIGRISGADKKPKRRGER